ncbi:MAG: CDP-glycerol glycerophosphotransferase family protein [Mogibacterium sp.]|nr:CDP-glycerol glycerophosphotransferase family protein [Mogibacterium sp.]
MNVIGVLKNIRKNGFKKTYKKYCNKKKHETAKQVLLAEKKKIESLEKENFPDDKINDIKDSVATINKIKKNLTNEELLSFLVPVVEVLKQARKNLTNEGQKTIYNDLVEEINNIEKKNGYRAYIKEKYIKHILPETYNTRRNGKIEKKMLFMQPRSGLNQSCRFMYNTIKKQKKYTPILFELYRDKGCTTEYYENARLWVFELATARACFVHESNDLLGYVDIRPETKIVQLFHGCGIIKRLGLGSAGRKGFKTLSDYEEYPEYNKYDLATISSPELLWVFEDFTGIKRSQNIIQPIGVSRTDEFFDEKYIQNCYKKIHSIIPESRDKKIILYAPTYRGLGKNRVAPNKLDFDLFAEKLKDDYILIIKQHQTVKDLPPIPYEYNNSFAFDMTRGKGMNINELMTVSDICISDYSSLVYEYSLFERPTIAFAFDIDEYTADRGVYYPLEESFPGPIFKTNEEVVEYIENIDKYFDKEFVKAFKNKFMSACDGQSTQRILDWIEAN